MLDNLDVDHLPPLLPRADIAPQIPLLQQELPKTASAMESRLTALGSVADALLPPLPEAAAAARATGDPAAALLERAGATQEQLLRVVEVIETQLTLQSRSQLHL